jgi:hypothetical protein
LRVTRFIFYLCAALCPGPKSQSNRTTPHPKGAAHPRRGSGPSFCCFTSLPRPRPAPPSLLASALRNTALLSYIGRRPLSSFSRCHQSASSTHATGIGDVVLVNGRRTHYIIPTGSNRRWRCLVMCRHVRACCSHTDFWLQCRMRGACCSAPHCGGRGVVDGRPPL